MACHLLRLYFHSLSHYLYFHLVFAILSFVSLLFLHAFFLIAQESSRSLLSLLPALRARIAASLTASAAAAIKEHVPKIMTAYRMTGATASLLVDCVFEFVGA